MSNSDDEEDGDSDGAVAVSLVVIMFELTELYYIIPLMAEDWSTSYLLVITVMMVVMVLLQCYWW